jgi:hypothetical protein
MPSEAQANLAKSINNTAAANAARFGKLGLEFSVT